jgi:hypothetical protein
MLGIAIFNIYQALEVKVLRKHLSETAAGKRTTNYAGLRLSRFVACGDDVSSRRMASIGGGDDQDSDIGSPRLAISAPTGERLRLS